MKLTFPLLNTTITVPVDETMAGSKKSRRALLRKRMDQKNTENVEQTELTEKTTTGNTATEKTTTEKTSVEESPANNAQKTSSQSMETSTQPFLIAEVVNVTHEKFRQTEEIKVRN